MFETMFKYSAVIERHRGAGMLEERSRFLEQRAADGLARLSIRMTAQYLLVVMEYLRLPTRPNEVIGAVEIEQAAIRWSQRKTTRNRQSRQKFVGHATRWLTFLGRWKPVPPTHCFVDHLNAYSDYMRTERGLSPATVSNRCWTVEDFLPKLKMPLARLTISHIDATIASRFSSKTYARISVYDYVGVLRDFFRFAEQHGWCQPGLAAALRGPRIFPQEGLPQGPTWEVVQRLIAECDGDKPVNVRNKAILLLLSVYGLRAGEIVRLRLDDLDWNEDRMTVQRSKNHRKQTYPLCRTVGIAISRYLREVRPPTTYRELFLTMLPRFRPLSRVALSAVVYRKLKALNVSLSHYGPHALRHACATHLLAEGLSFKEIGDLLGHRLPETTAIYAKVDISGLREVADFDLGGVL
jgi:site-specific recombinase XerD